MKWTKILPKRPGWYWRRLTDRTGACEPEMVEVGFATPPHIAEQDTGYEMTHRGEKVTPIEGALVVHKEFATIADDAWWEWAGPMKVPNA